MPHQSHVSQRVANLAGPALGPLLLLDLAGVDLAGKKDQGGGFNHEVHRHLTGSTATNTAPLVLDLDAKLGQITVEYQ